VTPGLFLGSRPSATATRRRHAPANPSPPRQGALWCGRCHDQGRDSRMLVQRAVGRHGGEYRYLFCFSRQNQNCDAPYIQVDDIEGGRPEPLRHHHLPPDFAERSGPSWTRRWPTKAPEPPLYDNNEWPRCQHSRQIGASAGAPTQPGRGPLRPLLAAFPRPRRDQPVA
jgi:hypothetical protein